MAIAFTMESFSILVILELTTYIQKILVITINGK